MNRLNIFRTHPDVTLPKFATKGSACFDLSFQMAGKVEYKGYNGFNAPITRNIHQGAILVMPGDRILVPTGYIFDIPEGYSVRIHARSGLSLKQGLILANSEAVIDSDYVEETMVMITNTSENPIVINNGDRIAQAEMIKSEEYVLWESTVRPEKKTERDGGLGSTGIVTMPTYPTGTVQLDPNVQTTLTEQPVKRGRGRPRKVA
jgi:dUTP pyrophosphatase